MLLNANVTLREVDLLSGTFAEALAVREDEVGSAAEAVDRKWTRARPTTWVTRLTQTKHLTRKTNRLKNSNFNYNLMNYIITQLYIFSWKVYSTVADYY